MIYLTTYLNLYAALDCLAAERRPSALIKRADAPADYPAEPMDETRTKLIERVREGQDATQQMLIDRADEIMDALTTPFLGVETYSELERELAEIQIQLEKE